MTTTTLDSLQSGDTAVITGTNGHDASLLRAMGLREGVEVTVRRVGEPCIVEAGTAGLGLAGVMSGAVHVAVTR